MIKKIAVVTVILILSVMSDNALGGEAILTWDYPTTNTNGTALTDLGGFKAYYGTSSGNYSSNIDVAFATCVTSSPCSSSTYTVTNLSNNVTYYFAATAYDTSGNESGFSNEVFKVGSGAPPTSIPAPTGVQVTANGGTVTVSWDKPNATVGGYRISRGPTPTLFNMEYDVGTAYSDSSACVVSYTGCTRRQFIFNGVTPGTYFLRVVAYDLSSVFGESSSAVSITIASDTVLPADVTNFSAAPYGTGVRLTWTNPSNADFAGVIISFSTVGNNGPWTQLANLTGATPGSNQAYNHLNLPVGTYYYKIQVKDISGNVTSTRYAFFEKRMPKDPIAVTNFTAKPSQYFKNVLISLDWPDNIDVKSAQLEYRIAGYTNKALLGEFDLPQNDETFWASHYYSDRLVGEKLEYILTVYDINDKQLTQANTTTEIPIKLESCECGGGGGEPITFVKDNAAVDFPKTTTKQKKENSGGFGCGTIKNMKPPDGGGTDVSAVAIAATVMLFIARRKLRQRIN